MFYPSRPFLKLTEVLHGIFIAGERLSFMMQGDITNRIAGAQENGLQVYFPRLNGDDIQIVFIGRY